ncbi:MAG: TetR/AcrR family transcriptional regulator [Thalassovita sp.]
MGRKSSLDEAQLFAAVGRHLTAPGAFSLKAVSAEAGVSIGSIYHRFGNKDGLLAETWLAANARFRTEFVEKFGDGSAQSGAEAACSVAQFCMDHPQEAVVLICNRPSDIIGPDIPDPIRQEVAKVHSEVKVMIADFATRNAIPHEIANLALIEIPRTVMRQYLPQRKVPEMAKKIVLDAYRGVMGL